MHRIGLTFDQHAEPKLKPLAGSEPVFQEAALELEQLFPMSISQASMRLRSRGYDCRVPMLELLFRNKVVAPASTNTLSRENLDIAAAHFDDAQIFTPYVTGCMAFGFTYADLLRVLR